MNESTNILKKRYITLDLIKIIAAYMVVFIHVSFPGHFGKVIVCLARFAVPLFFIISGYFSYSKIESCDIYRLRRKIESTGILFFGSIIFYVLAISCVIRKPERIGNWLANGSSLDALQNFIVWNELPMKEMEHLWFLGALLYCYICAYIFCRKKQL